MSSCAVGTEPNGSRWDRVLTVRVSCGRRVQAAGGEEDSMWVSDVGIGVGYLTLGTNSSAKEGRSDLPGFSRATRFGGGRPPGDDDDGSNAGKSPEPDAGRLMPASDGRPSKPRGGLESLMASCSERIAVRDRVD